MNAIVNKTAQLHPEATTARDVRPLALQEMPEAVREIRADCQLAPQEYLDEVRVPCGGE